MADKEPRRIVVREIINELQPYLEYGEAFDPFDPPAISRSAASALTAWAALQDQLAVYASIVEEAQFADEILNKIQKDQKRPMSQRMAAGMAKDSVEKSYDAKQLSMAVYASALGSLVNCILNGKSHPLLEWWQYRKGETHAQNSPTQQSDFLRRWSVICFKALLLCRRRRNSIHKQFSRAFSADVIARVLVEEEAKDSPFAGNSVLEWANRPDKYGLGQGLEEAAADMAKESKHDPGTIIAILRDTLRRYVETA